LKLSAVTVGALLDDAEGASNCTMVGLVVGLVEGAMVVGVAVRELVVGVMEGAAVGVVVVVVVVGVMEGDPVGAVVRMQ
jgi:hypothetical protein